MPHLALKSIYWAVDGSATRRDGYAISRRNRKRITDAFGWAKTVGGMAQPSIAASNGRAHALS
jgi:hypothetical protein